MKVRERAVRNASLLAVLLLVCALVVPAVAFAQTQVLDVAAISKIADGTHDGNQGTATRLNTANGYHPGDDTIDDGVVASGDIVAYDINISIQAARQRELWLVFDDANAPYLTTELIKDFRFSSAMVPVEEYEDLNGKKALHLTVRRGAAGVLKKTLTLTARDTAGVTQPGNYLEMQFYTTDPSTQGAQPVSTFRTDEVTVISAPFADLTLDTNTTGPIVYNTSALQNGGQFVIMPQALHDENYSQAGLIASSQWHTDINVSGLPAGTSYKLCPTTTDRYGRVTARRAEIDRDDTTGCETLTETGGVIKDVRGTGPKTLWYKMPESVAETTANYTINLDVKEDSFQVGDAKNVPDPGQDRPQTWDTSKYTIGGNSIGDNSVGGNSVGALQGRNIPNNNYSTARWVYVPPGQASSNLYAPFDGSKTIYETSDQQWPTEGTYVEQPRRLVQRANGWKITPGTQMYDLLTMNVGYDIYDATGISIKHQINTGTANDDMRKISYDPERSVVVRNAIGENDDLTLAEPVDEAKFTVNWYDQNDSPLGESKNPAVCAAYGVLSFTDPNALAATTKFYVAWPVKSNEYKNQNCQVTNPGSKSTETTPCQWFANSAMVTFAPEATALPGNNDRELTRSTRSDGYIVYPAKPILTHTVTGAVVTETPERHTLKWTIEDIVKQAPRSDGYHDLSTTFTLSKDLDPQTFELAQNSGWQCVRPDASGEPQTFSCTYSGPASLAYDNITTGKLPALVFTTQTIPYVTIATTDAIVHSKVSITQSTMKWDTVNGLEDTTTSGEPAAGEVPIPTSNNLEAVIQALTPVEETTTPITWRADMSVGALSTTGQWSQTVMLPKTGDEVNWGTAVCTNLTRDNDCKPVDTKVSIGEDGYDTKGAYDGYGKSNFHGTYTLQQFKINSYIGTQTSLKLIFSPDLEITAVENIEEDVNYAQAINGALPQDKTLADVKAIALEGYGITSNDDANPPKNTTPDPVQSTRVSFDITLAPTGNKPFDKYLMWLGPTWKKSENATEANASNSWPDLIETRLGTLSGVVYEDKNRSASFDPEDENRYDGLTVELKCTIAQTADPITDDQCWKTWKEYAAENAAAPTSGTSITVATTTTNADGSYVFDKVHGGDYQVNLPELTRINDSGNSNVNVAEGKKYDKLAPAPNRFKMPTQPVQTESYGKTWLKSDTTVAAFVPRAGTVANVNFGFVRPNDDLALNKSLPNYNPTTGQVSWDVTVKNTGNTVIKNIDVFDRTESKISGVTVNGQLAEQITGANALTAGNAPVVSGEIVATDNGVWLYGGSATNSYQRIAGITGSPVYVAGDQPKNQSLVCTTDGCWFVKGGNSAKATKLDGITGTIVNEKQIPFTSGNGVIATTDGVWTVSTAGELTHVKDQSGNYKPGEITSADSNNRDSYLVIGKRLYYISGATMIPYTFNKSGANNEDITLYQYNILRVGIGQGNDYGWNLQILTDLIDTAQPRSSSMTSKQQQDADNADAALCSRYTGSQAVKCAKLWRAANGTTSTNIIGVPASGAVTNVDGAPYNVSLAAHDVIEYRSASSIKMVAQGAAAQDGANIVATDRGYWTVTQGNVGNNYFGYQVHGGFTLSPDEEIKSTVRAKTNFGLVLTSKRVLLVNRQDSNGNGCATNNCYEADLSSGQVIITKYSRDSNSKELNVTTSKGNSLSGNLISGTPIKVYVAGQYAFITTTDGLYKVEINNNSLKITNIAATGDETYGTPLYATSNVNQKQTNIILNNDYQQQVAYTTKGILLINAGTTPATVTPLQAAGLSLAYTQGETTTSMNDNREFITRTYQVKQLDPGAAAIFTVTGTVLPEQAAFTVANQAWATSAQTPRQNLFCSTACNDSPAPGLAKTVAYSDGTLKQQTSGSVTWKIGNIAQSDGSHINLNYQTSAGSIVEGGTGSGGNAATEYLSTPSAAAADDLADMSYFGLPATPDLVIKHLAGQAWYDANSNGLMDTGEPAEQPVSGLQVSVFKVVGGTDALVSNNIVTNNDGKWSLQVQETTTETVSYYAVYSPLPRSYDGKTWVPTTKDVANSTLINSDADTAGFAGYSQSGTTISGVSSSPEPTAADSAHTLDIGLRPLTAGLTVTKGITDQTSSDSTAATPDSVVISGPVALPEATPEVSRDLINLSAETKIMPARSNRIVTTAVDDATPAFTFEFVYQPEDINAQLTKLRITDATRQGEAAIIQTRALKCAQETSTSTAADSAASETGSGTTLAQTVQCVSPQQVQLVPADVAGQYKVQTVDDSHTEVRLSAGEKIIGSFVVPFSSTKNVHEDAITVTALSAAGDDPNITYTELAATDAFKATYEQSNISLQLIKASTQDHDRLLSGAKFRVFRYAGTGEPSATVAESDLTYVSLATTDSTGKVTVPNLTQTGFYVLEEVASPWGYKPLTQRVWVRITWNTVTQKANLTCASISTDTCADATAWTDEAVEITQAAGTDNDPRTVSLKIYNERLVWILPHTGGPGILGLIGAGLALIFFSTWMYWRRYRNNRQES